MPDHSIPTRNTLVIGGGSNGKTSFGVRYLINVPWQCAFVFSTSPQIADRLKRPRQGTADECNAALDTGFVCFNPYRMFDVNEEAAAFDWFCDFAYQASGGGTGRKIMLADDTWEFSAGRSLSKPLARIVKLGRFVNLEFMGITHRPINYHPDLRALVTEWVAFNTVPEDLEPIKGLWRGVVAAPTLAKYEFMAFNRDTGAQVRSKLPPP